MSILNKSTAIIASMWASIVLLTGLIAGKDDYDNQKVFSGDFVQDADRFGCIKGKELDVKPIPFTKLLTHPFTDNTTYKQSFSCDDGRKITYLPIMNEKETLLPNHKVPISEEMDDVAKAGAARLLKSIDSANVRNSVARGMRI